MKNNEMELNVKCHLCTKCLTNNFFINVRMAFKGFGIECIKCREIAFIKNLEMGKIKL